MKKIIIVIFVIIIIPILFFVFRFFYDEEAYVPEIYNVNINDDNNITIKYRLLGSGKKNKIYYILKNNNIMPEVDDKDWKLLTEDTLSFKFDNNIYYAYLKNEDNTIYKVNDVNALGKITYLSINRKKIYLAIKDSFTPTLTVDGVGYLDKTITWTSDNQTIADVSVGGSIKGKSKGTTKVCASIMNENVCLDVVVTNLITKKPKKYNYKKPYLKCNKYSEKDNDLLDEILKDRINNAGYKTRAGAVEAARFLAMEFPYRITYFSENGRGYTNGVDGEGRFYHKGLYLHKSRFSVIKKVMNGPNPWGCYIYSVPAHHQQRNGFDCSGFISWVLYNGGFDVKDVGAGLASHLDLTDYGKRTKFTKDLIIKNKVKVGDLLSSGGPGGGHIAIIAGEDDKYFYVAESLWTSPNIGVVMVPYSKKTIYKTYYYVMLMDSYYKEDGNLTKMWY